MYADVGHAVRFVDVLVRQGHPGPTAPAYARPEQKRDDALRFVRDESIPWEVVIDGVDGSVHARYGLLPDPTYLIDCDGRVAFYSYWTHVPTLRRAVATLLACGGRGVVGEQRLPHPLAPLVDGWRAIERGLPQSADDMETVAPGSTLVLKAGSLAKPLLAPWALASRPWSRPQLAAALLVLGAAAVGLSLVRRSRHLNA